MQIENYMVVKDYFYFHCEYNSLDTTVSVMNQETILSTNFYFLSDTAEYRNPIGKCWKIFLNYTLLIIG